MEWCGTDVEKHRASWNTTEQPGAAWNRTEQCGVEWNSVDRLGQPTFLAFTIGSIASGGEDSPRDFWGTDLHPHLPRSTFQL